jgi:hypothetical protein
MENPRVVTSSPSTYRTLNALTSLAARMLDSDPEHLLEWYSVGLYSRQLLYCALQPEKAQVRP